MSKMNEFVRRLWATYTQHAVKLTMRQFVPVLLATAGGAFMADGSPFIGTILFVGCVWEQHRLFQPPANL